MLSASKTCYVDESGRSERVSLFWGCWEALRMPRRSELKSRDTCFGCVWKYVLKTNTLVYLFWLSTLTMPSASHTWIGSHNAWCTIRRNTYSLSSHSITQSPFASLSLAPVNEGFRRISDCARPRHSSRAQGSAPPTHSSTHALVRDQWGRHLVGTLGTLFFIARFAWALQLMMFFVFAFTFWLL